MHRPTKIVMNPDGTPKLGRSDLVFWSKSPAKNVGLNMMQTFSSQLNVLYLHFPYQNDIWYIFGTADETSQAK